MKAAMDLRVPEIPQNIDREFLAGRDESL